MIDIMNVIMNTVRGLLNAEKCTVFLADFEKKELWTPVGNNQKSFRISASSGVPGYVLVTGEVCNIADGYFRLK
jgi:signal transduction protein with GAF and PtsI domain